MSEIYLDQHYKVAVKLDTENELLFMYDLNKGVLKIPCQSDKIISRIDNERRYRI
jgi:hypothetical protein